MSLLMRQNLKTIADNGRRLDDALHSAHIDIHLLIAVWNSQTIKTSEFLRFR